ncbi:MAG TPA: hypothetical protein VKB56_08025 [Terriglobales bacterium]|nr:hypothetical protein [Terriglobales bacterium]
MIAGADDAVTKRSAPLPIPLSERMTISRLVQVLEELPFDSREQGTIKVDRVTRNFLISASRTAAAADLEQTVHDVLARRGPVRR